MVTLFLLFISLGAMIAGYAQYSDDQSQTRRRRESKYLAIGSIFLFILAIFLTL